MKQIINNVMKLESLEAFRYVIVGGFTTAINYIIFLGLNALGTGWLISNCIAWIGAVLFAFYSNRQLVFHSDGDRKREFVGFFSVRLATLVIENLLLFLFIDCLLVNEFLSKITVSVITVVLNYFACKYGIFAKEGVSNE